jgi:predicted transcriptional regulator
VKELGERLNVAECILRVLSAGSLRRTALEKKVFRSREISYSCFSCMFAFLVSDGDVEKVSAEHKAPFRLTEKGKAFLEWRSKT